MKKVLKLSFSIFLAMTMSLSNVVSIFAQEEENEQIVEIQDEIENEDLDVEENINSEEMNVESQIEDSDTNTELTGDSTCIEYFLLEESNVSSTQNFVLSLLKDEGYTNFSIDVSDAYGNLFNVESNERVNNLIKFTESFSSGAYIVTKIHYQLNEQNYVISLSDIGIEAKFGVNQEVYSENELVDLEEISEGSSSQEGVVSIDSENVNSSSEIIEEELNVPQSYSISSYALDNESDEIILCLDPGHGGSESGTYTYYSSQNGLYEKYYNLKIAQYCKQELEKYANVKVYLTRYDDTYLDLKERAQIASDYGASYLISFHLNGLNGTNRGAVIFYPNTNYRPDLSEDGKVVAQSVLNELTALGIQSMGIRTNTIDGHDEKYDYPDGSEGDYYGVIRHAKNLGITGLIIEHCFADNKADFDAFLSSESKLQNLGIADATGIAKALGLSIDTTTMDQLAYENKDVLKDGTYEIFNGSDFNTSISVKDASINENATIIQDNSSTDSNGWSVSHDEKGYVIITNKLSGKVLSLNSDSLFQNQSVIQKENNNSYLNKWIVKKENSSYKIVSAVKSNYVLACIDNKVVIQQEENNKNQEWILNSYTPIRTKIDAYAAENKSSISDGTYIIGTKMDTNCVMDVYGASGNSGANVTIYEEHGKENQAWIINHDEKGYVTIKNVNSGLYLSVLNGTASNLSNIGQSNINGYASKWIVVSQNGGYKIVSALNTNYTIDLNGPSTKNGTNITLYKSNGHNNQTWIFEKYVSTREQIDAYAAENKSSISDGTYIIGTKMDTNCVMDVYGASGNSGANVTIYEEHGKENQAWIINHDEKGYVTIKNVNSGLYLSVLNGTASNLSNIGQSNINGYASKWIVVSQNGGYKIVSALNTNYTIDLNGPSTKNGTNITLYKSNGHNNQTWIFEKYVSTREQIDAYAAENKSSISDGTYIIGTKMDTNCVMDVYGASGNSGANVTIYEEHGKENQAWIINHDEKGYVTIKNVNSGLYLSVLNGTATNLSNIGQSNINGYASKWIVVSQNGGYKIVSALNTNYTIDLNGPSTKNGTNITLYKSNGQNNQIWVFSFVEPEQQPELPETTLHPIMGNSEVTVNQIVSYFKSKNPNYDTFSKYGTTYNGILASGGAPTIESFCQMYYEEALMEGIKPEIAFAQAMLETGFLQYGGDVKPDQYNFAGMGATGNGVAGNSFDNVRMGIRAHIQHLKCYASTEPLNNDRVDPRWSESLRGKALYVEYLSIPNNPYGTGWAVDPNYADKLLNVVNEIKTK